MKNQLLRGVKSFASRFLIALVILQSFAFIIPAANAADQTAYRWRNDDGTETSATYSAAENTTANILRGDTERLRLGVQHEVADGDVSTDARLNSGDDSYWASGIDGNYLYVGTTQSPARLLKFDTTTGPPYDAPAEIALDPGENNVYTLALDIANDLGYFVTSTLPSKVIKVQLSTFTRVDTLTLNAGSDYAGGSVIHNGYLYVVTRTYPGLLEKVNLTTFTQVTSDTLDLGDDLTYSFTNPSSYANKLYFADGNNYVTKIDVTSPGSTAPTIEDTETIPTPGSPYNTATYTYVYGTIVDTTNEVLYTTNYYGLLHKIDISGGGFTYDDYLPLAFGGLQGAFAIDEANGKLYVGSYSPDLAKIDTATFTQDAYTVSVDYANLMTIQISSDGSTVYAPTWMSPAHIVEIDTSTMTDTTVFDGATRGDNGAYSAVIDTATDYMYIGTSYNDRINGDSIIQVDRTTMATTGRIDLPDGYESLGAAAIDVADRKAYFIDYNAPSHLIRVDLDSFPAYDVLTLPADGPYYYHYDAMAIDPDPAHHYLYLGSYGVPSVITQIDLDTFTRGTTLELLSTPLEDRVYNSIAIDTVNDKLYVGAGSTAGRIIRVDVSGSNVTRDGAINTPGYAFPYVAAVDESAGFLYLGINSADILKVNIANGTTLSVVGSVTVGGYEDYLSNFSIDEANDILYVGGASTPGKLFRVELSPFSYDPNDDVIAPGGEEYIYTVNVDSNDGSVYYASYQGPILLTKVTATPKKQLRLEYAPKVTTCSAGSYTAVQSGNDFVPMLSGNVTNGTVTTNSAGITDPAALFKPGYFVSASGQAPGTRTYTDQFTEVEYSFKAASSALPGDYCFRLTDAGSPLATYTNYAEATLKTNDVTINNAGTLTTLTAGATATVTISFTLQNDFPSGTLTVTFPGDFTGITAPTTSLGTCVLDTFGAAGQDMTAEKNNCFAGDTVILTGGTVVNPAIPGLYTITWTNDDPGFTIVAIVDSDQVNVAAQVSPSITFDLNTGTTNAGGPPYAVPLGSLTPGTVKSSDNTGVNSIWANLTTNAAGGALVTVLSQYAALASTSVPADTIPNSASVMTGTSANYGLCVNSVATGTDPFVRDADYAALTTCTPGGTVNNVAALSSITPDPILNTAGGPVQSAIAEILVNANADTTTISHTDYMDVLTFIATGTF